MKSSAGADVKRSNTVRDDTKWTIETLRVWSKFTRNFEKSEELGVGSDGAVYKYQHRITGDVVAVKTQRYNTAHARWAIQDEIANYMIVGTHDHIAGMIADSCDFHSSIFLVSQLYTEVVGPAIFLEVAGLGDLTNYIRLLWKEQREKGLSRRTPEATIWKLFRDIALGLNHLHNCLVHCYVHMDLKPGNILVYIPPDYLGNDRTPIEPIFKIADFARLCPYPPHPDSQFKFAGTLMFAAPWAERNTLPVAPPVDVYSLGATIQYIALNLYPTENREHLQKRMHEQGKYYPRFEEEWNNPYWQDQLQAMYRPLNASATTLALSWDISNSPECLRYHKPYSDSLNTWYMSLFQPPSKRISSAYLAQYLAPKIDEKFLPMARHLDRAGQAFEKRDRIRGNIGPKYALKKSESDVVKFTKQNSDPGDCRFAS